MLKRRIYFLLPMFGLLSFSVNAEPTKKTEQEDKEAQYNLGLMYENGEGVESNLI